MRNSWKMFLVKMKLAGFTESKKGCCGDGLTQFGASLKGLSICTNRSKYIYWDAVHFTEKMYYIIAEESVKSLIASL